MKNLERLMSFSRPIQWYHSHANKRCNEPFMRKKGDLFCKMGENHGFWENKNVLI